VPFRSKAQLRKLRATKPELAARWERTYGVPANLPERANGLQGQLRKRRAAGRR
jgi:hypothetical protein